MNGKKWIIGFLVIYLVLGCVTICVYANDLGYFDRSAPAAGEQETESEMVSTSPPEQVAMTTSWQERKWLRYRKVRNLHRQLPRPYRKARSRIRQMTERAQIRLLRIPAERKVRM